MPPRLLLVTADDFGIGPETSRGILDLAERGAVRSTVLLVNSPYAQDAVRTWRRRGRPVELGWHPCLTLDAPMLAPERVPSLVDRSGRFHRLGPFLRRLAFGRIVESEIEAELSAQLERFQDWVESPPANVNAHHHVHVFGPVRRALARILDRLDSKPFVRRVFESGRTLSAVPGGRWKRRLLTRFGRVPLGDFPGNDELIGITDPPCVREPDFFRRWLSASTGSVVELTCHPGHFDRTLIGRDGSLEDGQIHRRVAEFERLADPSFDVAVRAAGFVPVNGVGLGRILPADLRSLASVA